MQNYKIKVSSEAESREVQELFFELGYAWLSGSKEFLELNSPYLYTAEGRFYCGDLHSTFNEDGRKKLTIPQLCDLVVLKRNDPKDANVYQDDEVPCLYDLYLTSDKNLYFFHHGEGWTLSNINNDENYRELLKPIAKEPTMKEFLNPMQNYKLFKMKPENAGHWMVEVPDGMNYAHKDEFNIHFTKLEMGYRDSVIVWQRETLNDKVATAEVARQEFTGAPFNDLPEFKFEAIDDFVESNVEQTLNDRESTYGSFRDVAATTKKLMCMLSRDDYSCVQQEALHMICSKLSRIANGNPNHVDSWHDIAGYATLVGKDINENSSKD